MVQVGDAIPLVDLRALGAPVSLYACRVARLVVNGAAVALSRPPGHHASRHVADGFCLYNFAAGAAACVAASSAACAQRCACRAS